MSIVRIKRIEGKTSWGAKNVKTGKYIDKYEHCTDKWVPALNIKTGLLRTGLEEDDIKKLAKKLGLKEEQLAPAGDFWDNFSIVIDNDGLVLDVTDPLSEIKYKALVADPTVARSLKEADEIAGKEYVITNESEEAKVKNSRREIIAKAYSIYGKLSSEEVMEVLMLFGKESIDMDPEVCRDVLGDIVENSPAKFLETVGDEGIKEKVWIIKLIRAGILRKVGRGIGYNLPIDFGDIRLGNTIEEAIVYLKEKENQNIYVALKKAHEAYKKK